MRRTLALTAIAATLALAAACGAGGGASKEIKSGEVGRMTVTLASDDGVLRHGDAELTVTFRDSSGKAADVGSASLNFHMPAMGAMAAMNDAATLTTTSEPGVYRARVNLQMAGEWQAQIAYEGPAGAGKGSFAVTAR
jgi:ABC-type glycerol-3-phosphate transport system substrate-binding protein